MPIMKRYLAVRPTAGETVTALAETLLMKLGRLMADEAGVENLPGWPEGDWPHAQGRYWQAETSDALFFELKARLRRGHHDWEIELALGFHNREYLILGEKWHTQTTARAVPYEDLPTLTAFLKHFETWNADGREAFRVMFLDRTRVDAFADFLSSPTRQLPVVLIAPRPQEEDRDLAYRLRDALYGLGHVVLLRPNAVESYCQVMPDHACYDGAVRLYMPGYRPTDRAWLHPFWRRHTDPEELRRELVDRIARESVFQDEHEVLADLRRQRDEAERRLADRLRREKLEEERQRLRAQDAEETWRALAEDYRRQAEELEAQNNQLLEELRQSQGEVRRLRWQLNQQWGQEEPAPPSAPSPQVWLSAQAQETYRSLDESERAYWDKNVLPKLREPALRDNQREPVSGKGSRDCFVYPRGRGADGRRVIYYEQEGGVFICELFTAEQHDREYNTRRTQGIDSDAYGGWSLWEA